MSERFISQYRLDAVVGEGAMGVVYRAFDTRLGRTVAVKVLSARQLADPLSAERMLREARAAAHVSHPNVCTVFDVGTSDAGETFIVMEFINGRTLSSTIEESNQRGLPIPFDDVRAIAIQAGRGLAAAHAEGIVHRDIKGDNIMIDSVGRVVVMDFGLALTVDADRLTRTSSIVGTVAYMAPEVIRGEEPDVRSDIYGLGVVLYEAICGRRPFRGAHEAALMYAILNEDPPDIASLRSDVPADLQRVVERCLAREPSNRYQSATELVRDLGIDQTSTTPSTYTGGFTRSTSSSLPSIRQPAGGVHVKRRLVRWGVPAAVLALAIVGWYVLMPATSLQINPAMTTRRIPLPINGLSGVGVSADGNWVVVGAPDGAGTFDLYQINLQEGVPRRLTFDSVNSIAWVDVAPDGSRVAFEVHDPDTLKSGVFVMSILGGQRQRIIRFREGSCPTWTPDGAMVGYLRNGSGGSRAASPSQDTTKLELWTCAPDGSGPRRIIADPWYGNEQQPVGFAWSPDAQSVAWLRTMPDFHQEVVIHDITTGKERTIVSDKANVLDVVWTHDDRILFTSTRDGTNNLWGVRLTGGDPVRLTHATGSVTYPRVSRDGNHVVYVEELSVSQIWVGSIDSGSARQITSDDNLKESPSLSPDGAKIAFSMIDASGDSQIIVMDRDGTRRRPLTTGRVLAAWPVWSPDGRWIAYSARADSEPTRTTRVYVVGVENQAGPRLIGDGCNPLWIDSTTLFVNRLVRAGGSDLRNQLYRATLDGKRIELGAIDSVVCIPVNGGGDYLSLQFRSEPAYWSVFPVTAVSGGGEAVIRVETRLRDIRVPASLWVGFNRYVCLTIGALPNADVVYYCNSVGELRKASLRTGLSDPVRGTFPTLSPQAFINVRYDQRELAYQTIERSTRVVVLDNPWQ